MKELLLYLDACENVWDSFDEAHKVRFLLPLFEEPTPKEARRANAASNKLYRHIRVRERLEAGLPETFTTLIAQDRGLPSLTRKYLMASPLERISIQGTLPQQFLAELTQYLEDS